MLYLWILVIHKKQKIDESPFILARSEIFRKDCKKKI